MRVSILKLYSITSCGYRDTSRWRLASIKSLCSESFKHRVVANQPYSRTEYFFKNEVAYKTYLKFITFGWYSSDENSISSLIRFDTTVSNAVDAFASNSGLNQNAENVLHHVRAIDSSSLHSVKSSINFGRTVCQESSERTNSCCQRCCKNCGSYLSFVLCKRSAITHQSWPWNVCSQKGNDGSKAKWRINGAYARFPNATN